VLKSWPGGSGKFEHPPSQLLDHLPPEYLVNRGQFGEGLSGDDARAADDLPASDNFIQHDLRHDGFGCLRNCSLLLYKEL
jgi:hypothetical protein